MKATFNHPGSAWAGIKFSVFAGGAAVGTFRMPAFDVAKAWGSERDVFTVALDSADPDRRISCAPSLFANLASSICAVRIEADGCIVHVDGDFCPCEDWHRVTADDLPATSAPCRAV